MTTCMAERQEGTSQVKAKEGQRKIRSYLLGTHRAPIGAPRIVTRLEACMLATLYATGVAADKSAHARAPCITTRIPL